MHPTVDISWVDNTHSNAVIQLLVLTLAGEGKRYVKQRRVSRGRGSTMHYTITIKREITRIPWPSTLSFKGKNVFKNPCTDKKGVCNFKAC